MCKFYLHNLLSFLLYTFEHNWKKESCFVQKQKKKIDEMHSFWRRLHIHWLNGSVTFFLSLFIFFFHLWIYYSVFRLRFFYYLNSMDLLWAYATHCIPNECIYSDACFIQKLKVFSLLSLCIFLLHSFDFIILFSFGRE